VAQRFSQAVEQLGATNDKEGPAVDVRTGALFSLRAIGLDSKDLAEPALFFAASYVGNNYEPPQKLNEQKHGCDQFHAPSTDVSTALRFVLPDVSEELLANAQDPDVLGLRGAPLRGLGINELGLTRFDLTQIKLGFSNLNNADFRESTLVNAKLDSACLVNADLQDADLRGASMVETRLSNANLEGSDLRDADLAGANLTNANMEGAKLSRDTLEHAALSREQREEIVVVP
jgi:uncharacterized protein YjbI with pentapeptide repeats